MEKQINRGCFLREYAVKIGLFLPLIAGCGTGDR
jgi:hypothetical protein